jgi:membrane protease YdiL (CAAX protease family)
MSRPDRPLRLIAGLVAVYLVFHVSAAALGSDRGQAGIVVAGIVVSLTLVVERLLFERPIGRAVRELGLGRPAPRGIIVALVVATLLCLVIPAFAVATGVRLTAYPGWLSLIPGLFAQAGIAEETLFRGYLFRHFRRGRSFWRAAASAAVPFVAVHLVMFVSQPWPIAMAALVLSTLIAFPLAHLFELGGNTIWPPAIVHFVVQGAIKVVQADGPSAPSLPIVWMMASATIPFLAFPVRPLAGAVPPVQLSEASAVGDA